MTLNGLLSGTWPKRTPNFDKSPIWPRSPIPIPNRNLSPIWQMKNFKDFPILPKNPICLKKKVQKFYESAFGKSGLHLSYFFRLRRSLGGDFGTTRWLLMCYNQAYAKKKVGIWLPIEQMGNFMDFLFLLFFLQKSSNLLKKLCLAGKTSPPVWGDLSLTFWGHIPDFNPLELVELCQNHPPWPSESKN